jgi:predicted DNA-binding transcriptional regulator YafY
MIDNDTKRISRLTAILTQLQTKRLLTATKLAEKFGVTIRTIYRDIKALEQAGVPIFTEEGKGYSLIEGYRIPPVMFTEKEANALITAEQLVLANKDTSFVKDFTDAINKIRSVLPSSIKYKTELLSRHIVIKNNYEKDRSSHFLALFQIALTNYNPVLIKYNSVENKENSLRTIEPFFIYNSTTENWLIVAWCRMRKDFRTFRLDRILNIELLNETYRPHNMTIAKYFEDYKKNIHP